jgi:hypothetical protein
LVSEEEVADVISRHSGPWGQSRSSENPIIFGTASTGGRLAVVFVIVPDPDSVLVYPITANPVEDQGDQTMSTKARMTPEQAARINQPAFRAEARSARHSLEHERSAQGAIATTDEKTEPEDAIALAKFNGGLRHQRELCGLSLTDVADRSGIDKA